jgi:hypothetical protein
MYLPNGCNSAADSVLGDFAFFKGAQLSGATQRDNISTEVFNFINKVYYGLGFIITQQNNKLPPRIKLQ